MTYDLIAGCAINKPCSPLATIHANSHAKLQIAHGPRLTAYRLKAAAFGSGGNYRKFQFQTCYYRSVHLPTRKYYSSTRPFLEHHDQCDFATFTFKRAASTAGI